jgi:hypothetical protein
VAQPGNIIRNNTFINCYNSCFVSGCCGEAPSARLLAPELVNNTFQLAGDGLYVGPSDGAQILIGDGWGTAASKAVIKNNIVTRTAAASSQAFAVRSTNLATVLIDSNLWGANLKLTWGTNPSTTSFATWRTNVQANVSGGEATSISAADPLFVSASDLHLQATSPARDAGVDLSSLGFNSDSEGQARPQGPRWDLGADEFASGGPLPPAPPLLLSLEPLP